MVLMVQDVEGCARCDEEHLSLAFRELTHPVRIPVANGEEAVYTHWAPCPTNGEPILFRSQTGSQPRL